MMNTTTIPGLDPSRRAWLAHQAAELVGDASATGVDLARYVLHLEPGSVALERRTDLADRYELAGVRPLARKLRDAVVPTGSVLVLVDCDETHLTLAPIAALTGATS